MASLQNKKIKDTYEGLLKTSDNVAIDGIVEITDGAGNSTGVSISNDGSLTATGQVTANSFVGDGSGLTNIPHPADTVTSVNGEIGDVVLSTSDIAEGTNLYYTDARVSANADVVANSAKNSYPSEDASKLAGIESGAQVNDVTSVNTQTGVVVLDADDIDDTTTTNKFTSASDISKLSGIESGADVTDSANVTTALNSISIKELSDISATNPTNNQVLQFNSTSGEYEPITLSSTAPVDSVNGQTGAVVLDTDDVSEGSTNLYYTDARVSANTDVVANTAKVGITTQQASDITTNNAKVGITTDQADAIVANTAKVGITTAQADAIVANTAKNSYPTADATKLAGIEAGAQVNPTSTDGLSEGTTNLYYTDARVSANSDVVANTAKNSYPSADATKVGHITVTQAVDLDTIESDVATNNAKVGITAQQASDITANNAKISFDSASSTKLAGIEAGAQVNTVDSVNTQTGAVVLDADDIDDTSTTNKWSTASEKTKLGYISVTQAVDLDSIEQKQNSQFKAIGLATDFGFRVLSDSGKVEGTQCIMQNMEILILN